MIAQAKNLLRDAQALATSGDLLGAVRAVQVCLFIPELPPEEHAQCALSLALLAAAKGDSMIAAEMLLTAQDLLSSVFGAVNPGVRLAPSPAPAVSYPA